MIPTLLATVAFSATTLTPPMPESPALNRVAQEALAECAKKFGAPEEDLAISVAVLNREKGTWESGAARGSVDFYPASVVKLFYLAYLSHLVATDRLKLTPEIERGAHDMIVDSDNDATNWVFELITGTTSGPELSRSALRRFMDRRQVVNKWFTKLGYPALNASQKTWYSGPYGRDRQGYGPNWERRNALCTNVCVRLMAEIALDQMVDPKQCAWMRSFLERKIPADGEADAQSRGYTGKVLPKGAKLWSKAGWTDTVRHDLAWVRMPSGREYVLALFTKSQKNVELVPAMAKAVLDRLEAMP